MGNRLALGVFEVHDGDMTTQAVEEVLKEHWPLTNHQCRCKAKFVVTSLLREHIAKAIATAE